MSAIDMLEEQHREVEDLFDDFEAADSPEEKREIFEEIADRLAVHTALEERHFYPAIKRAQTEDILHEAVEEHLSMKRIIADLLKLDAEDEAFEAKVNVLREQLEHHVEEEEDKMFPKVAKLLDAATLDALEHEMSQTEDELMAEGAPREQVPRETQHAAPV